MTKYHNSELITKDRMEDEDWYSDYQALREIMCAGPLNDHKGLYEEIENGREKALLAANDYFKKFPGPTNWIKPDNERILRWIDSCWLSTEQIKRIREI